MVTLLQLGKYSRNTQDWFSLYFYVISDGIFVLFYRVAACYADKMRQISWRDKQISITSRGFKRLQQIVEFQFLQLGLELV